MSLKRILKLMAAFLAGQGVSIVTQLLIPPLFLARYANGMESYGEWLVLTAAVSYLGTLNYGIQNYTTNQMAIHYNRGELDEAKIVQASALRLILILIAFLCAAGSGVLLMPISSWMGLRHIDNSAASLTLFLMLLQFVVGMLFAVLADSYMVVGQAHRGNLWINAQRLFAVLVLAGFVWRRASFPTLAVTQLGSMMLFTLLTLVDVRVTAPVLLPSLRYGSTRQMIASLRPSAHFGLLSISAFLVWQGPLLVMAKLLGPASVAVFAMSRAVFSMSRQLLAVSSYSIGQDITHLIGQRNWPQLRRLYELSEKVVLFLIPTLTLGTLLICPLLFTVWLHHRSVYEPITCMLMAAVSSVIGIKEHKWQFQWSSNEHESLARFSSIAYAIMLAASALLMGRFGTCAFLYCWLVTELVLVVYVIYLNHKLFPSDMQLSVAPIFRLLVVLLIAFALAAWPVWQDANWPLAEVVAVVVIFSAILAGLSYFVFGVDEVRAVVERKLRRRLRTAE